MAPIVECLLGPAETTVGNDTYAFTRDARGRYVADVQNIKHLAILTGLPSYAEVRDEVANSTALTPPAETPPVVETPVLAAPSVNAPDPAAAPPAADRADGATDPDKGDDEEIENLADDDFEGHPESEEEEAAMAAAAAAEQSQYLLGSDILPEVIAISAELNVGLGDVVNRAFADSGLELAAWNALPADDRENRLVATIDVMQKEAAPAPAPAEFALLHGIGKASEEKLHNAGVLTFQQLAELSGDQLAELDKRLGLNGLAVRGKWNELALAHLTDPK